ncbi:alpha/beta hydrolase [Pseudalkalibacillus decolorationis]|uniref:alpha/beta hydrolase n=1 Tax=Pseudalkalibacillus decolorationis TaxID=163879 RepID=UPI0021484203|nr:alpha/beta hydrolase [Pseudalkalibacillus decolorationis]
MKQMTYTHLLNETINIYDKNGSLQAYQFINENADMVDGNQAQIYNFRYALAAASGLEKDALQLMKEAIIENGFWYAYDYLNADEDLKSLHKYEEFHKMVHICKEREAEAKDSAKPELRILQDNSGNDDKKPLMFALHGDQENIHMTEPYWNSIVTEGYTVALPQSSQIQFSDGFDWNDVEKGSNELKEHFESIVNDYKIDRDNIIIGGFSAGCRVALNIIINGKIPAKGFVFVAPWLPEIEEWKESLDQLKENDIKGYIIIGDNDGDCFEGANQFASFLNQKSIPHEFKVVDDLDHEYPENFDQLLKEAVDYINE